MNDYDLSRKQLLTYGAAGAVGLGALGLVGCGDDDPDSKSSDVKLPSTPTGTLRAGFIDLGATAPDPSGGLDPNIISGNSGGARGRLVWDYLFEFIDGKVVMLLAEEAESSADAKSWDLTLRQGVEWEDGRPLTPEDVVYTVKGYTDPRSANAFLWAGAEAKKTGPRNVRITFPTPKATFLEMFGFAAAIIPENWDPKKPTGGTGPYRVVSNANGKTVLEAKTDWWRAGQGAGPYAERIEIIGFKDDTARLNALLADQIDVIDNPPVSQLQTLDSGGGFSSVVTHSEAASMFSMDAKQEPFSDVRVRQAMRLIVDRAAMNQQVLQGKGAIGNDIMSPLSPGYIGGDIEQREVDIEQAKSLLKAAGKENLTVELSTAPIGTGTVEMAQVLIEQAKAAGVTIKLKQLDAAQWYAPEAGYGSRSLEVATLLGGSGYFGNANTLLTSTAAFNTSHFADKRYDALYTDAIGTLDADKRNELIGEMQKIEHDSGTQIIWGFSPNITAFNDKVKNVTTKPTISPMNNYSLNTLSVA
ncbi:MAG TPA: ABC transporter substrate-binding protein [Baekduia sp.]|nr:ABC transporter substrate-binding protein [Baekduia sp.]